MSGTWWPNWRSTFSSNAPKLLRTMTSKFRLWQQPNYMHLFRQGMEDIFVEFGNSWLALELITFCIWCHPLLRSSSTVEENAYLIQRVHKIILDRLETEAYAFVVPVMKALLEKSKDQMQLNKELPSLSFRQTSPEFFEVGRTFVFYFQLLFFFVAKYKFRLRERFQERKCFMVYFWAVIMQFHHNQFLGECKILDSFLFWVSM